MRGVGGAVRGRPVHGSHVRGVVDGLQERVRRRPARRPARRPSPTSRPSASASRIVRSSRSDVIGCPWPKSYASISRDQTTRTGADDVMRSPSHPTGRRCRSGRRRPARRRACRVEPHARGVPELPRPASAGRWRGGVMARGGPGVAWRVRELVDRSARQSPARLALGVFGLVIALVTLGLSAPWATAERAARTVRRRAVHRRVRQHRHRPGRRAHRRVLVRRGAWSSSSSPSRSAGSAS